MREIAREIIRNLQVLRKDTVYVVSAKNSYCNFLSSSLVKEAVEKFKEKIMAETLALSLEENIDNADGESSIDANNESVTIKVKK